MKKNAKKIGIQDASNRLYRLCTAVINNNR